MLSRYRHEQLYCDIRIWRCFGIDILMCIVLLIMFEGLDDEHVLILMLIFRVRILR